MRKCEGAKQIDSCEMPQKRLFI